MRDLRRTSRALALLAAGALLAGCGGAPEAAPPPSQPASPGVEATEAAPDQPRQASANSRQGAGAFVEHYIAVLNYATATGDLREARRLSAPTCESCRAMLDAVQSVYAKGGSVEGGGWTPELVSAIRAGKGWVIDARLDFAPQIVTPREGAEPERFPGGDGTASFTVARQAGAWVVTETTRA